MTAVSELPRLTPGQRALALGVGVVSFALLYVTSGAIDNDHFVIYSRAMQVVGGDWPVRDFEDPGMPLTYLSQAVVAWGIGSSLLVNVVYSTALLAVTASLTFVLAVRACRHTWLALALAATTVVFAPRLYNASKVLVPMVATSLAWAYAARPSHARAVGLGLWSAVAFLVRYDYMVYVLAASVALIVAAEPRSAGVRRAALCTAVAVLAVMPWLVYVHAVEGLPTYFSTALAFVAAEGRRTAGTPSWLLYLVALAWPAVGLASAWRRPPSPERLRTGYVALLSLLVAVVFLRDNLATRGPDVVALYAVLAATLVPHLPALSRYARGVAVVVVAIVAGSALGHVPWARVQSAGGVLDRVSRVTQRLRFAAPEIQPNPRYAPIVSYLARCTPPNGRVLVGGFAPELPVLGGRLFASGVPYWLPGYYEDTASIGRARARLDRERVSVAVLVDGASGFREHWPDLAAWFDARQWREYAAPTVSTRLRVWLPASAAAAPSDPSTSLPCPTA